MKLKEKIRNKLMKVVSDSLENSEINNKIDNVDNKIDKVNDELNSTKMSLDDAKKLIEETRSQLIKTQDELKGAVNLIKYNTDRQGYLNGFSNPEYSRLEKHKNGDILLCGNYGDPNTGDDIMMQTILDYIDTSNIKEHVTVMLVPNHHYDTGKYKNISFIHFPQTLFDFDILSDKFDKVIFGGGAIIEEEFYQEGYAFGVSICRTFVDLSIRFIKQNKPNFNIALSTSKELHNEEYIEKLKFVIENSTYISIRDTNSIDTLKNVGINCDNIILTKDIVYANKELISFISNSDFKVNQDKVNIGIVFICEDDTIGKLESLIEKISNYYTCNNKDYKISLIPFFDARHNDTNYFNAIKEKYENIFVYNYVFDMTELIEAFKNQSVIFSMRYHGSLAAMAMGIPSINIWYNEHPHYFNKIKYLMEQFNTSLDRCVKLTDIDNIDIKTTLSNAFINSDKKLSLDICTEAQNELDNFISKIEVNK